MAGRGRGLTLPAWMTSTSQPAASSPLSATSAGLGAPPLAAPPHQIGGQPLPGIGAPPAYSSAPSSSPIGAPPQVGGYGPPAHHLGMLPMPPQYSHPHHGGGLAPPGVQGYFPQAFDQQPPQPLPEYGQHLQLQQPPLVPVGGFMHAPPAALASSSADTKPEWTVHDAPDGRKYYFNTKTGKSMWEKPLELMTPIERADAISGWKEFTAKDGRKYYYNKETKESKWTMPEEMIKAREEEQNLTGATPAPAAPARPEPVVQVVPLATPAQAPPPASMAVPTPSQPQQHQQSNGVTTASQAAVAVASPTVNSSGPPAVARAAGESKAEAKKEEGFQYATKAEAKDAFKALLKDVNCNSDWSWEQAMRQIVSDKRYGALKSLGEKKACFNEYLQQRKRDEKDEARMKLRQIREEFVAMLEESTDLRVGDRLSRVVHLFQNDPRWKAIDNPRERDELFEDHMRQRDRKERKEREAKRLKCKSDFRAILMEDPNIKVTSQWRKVKETLENNEVYRSMDKMDALDAFQDHIRYLELKERELKEREKEELKQGERRNRDAFTELLKSHAADGKIHPRMRWKEYQPLVAEDAAFVAVEANLSGSRPRELFEDILEEVEEKYEKDKEAMKEVVKSKELTVDADSAMEPFLEAINEGLEDIASISETNKKHFFLELQGRAKDKLAKEEKRKKQAKDSFLSMLKKSKSVTLESTWESVKEMFEGEPEFKALESDEVRKELLQEHMGYLQSKRAKAEERERKDREESDDGGSDDEDRKRHKKERRHKRSKRRSATPESEDDGDRSKSRKQRQKRNNSDSDSDMEKRQGGGGGGSKRHKKDKDRKEDRDDRDRHRDRDREDRHRSKEDRKDRSRKRDRQGDKEKGRERSRAGEEHSEEGEL